MPSTGIAVFCTDVAGVMTSTAPTVTTFDVRTGALLSKFEATASDEFTDATAGTVDWHITDDSLWIDDDSVGCTGPQWNRRHTEVAGTVSIANGTSAPAVLDYSTGSPVLTILGQIQQSTGFDAASGPIILDVVFGPDDKVWWLQQDPGSATVTVFDNQKTVGSATFSRSPAGDGDAHLLFGTSASQWAIVTGLQNDNGDPQIGTANGVVTEMPFEESSPETTAPDLTGLLPATNYTVGVARVADDDSSVIGFVATSPSGDTSFFTVPISGGEPTQLGTINGGIGYVQFIYFSAK